MSHEQFQLEEFKTFLNPYRNGLPDYIAIKGAAVAKKLGTTFVL